ncbi:F-box/kelch-repeat protein At3g06240-like [Rosa rugosa]|uniref:F-box/kelch-repeat protein At3g06240-like n=1 Tax=Rosa rugosa TaxID=74645 RepID=UPI002B412107|nr:F-box/kelch-repeat protein At3g06240-like [Rosa rugosa]
MAGDAIRIRHQQQTQSVLTSIMTSLLRYCHGYRPNLYYDFAAPLQASVLKLDDGDVAITELDYPGMDDFEGECFPNIYGSCNGLICIEFGSGSIILWNPCTREFKQLPAPELHICESSSIFESFVYLAGFGYDSTIEDYKVIRATKIYEAETTLQVFTLKTGSWRRNPDFNHISQGSEYIYRFEKQGFLLNETLHWVALLRGAEYEEGTLGIVSLGLAEEKFKVMALFPCHSPISASILTVGNSLFVYHEFGIWMMKEHGVEESWTKVIYISPECLPQHFDNMLTPLCILENGEVLLRCRSLGLYIRKKRHLEISLARFARALLRDMDHNHNVGKE